MHGIYSYVDVLFTRQKLLQSSKVEDVPQHVSVGFHRVHNFHWTPQMRNTVVFKYINAQAIINITINYRWRTADMCHVTNSHSDSDRTFSSVSCRGTFSLIHHPLWFTCERFELVFQIKHLFSLRGQIHMQSWTDGELLNGPADLKDLVCDSLLGGAWMQ